MFEKEFENLFKSFDRLAEQQARTEAQMAETDKKIKEVSQLVGNISNNNGSVIEEFFWNALRNKKELNGIKIDYSDKNIHRRKGNTEDEFDILLWNGNSVIVVEVKYKLHPDDLEKLKDKKIPNFKTLFPDKQTQNIYGAIASWSIPKEVKEQAQKLGFLVLSQSGENMSIEPNELKAY